MKTGTKAGLGAGLMDAGNKGWQLAMLLMQDDIKQMDKKKVFALLEEFNKGVYAEDDPGTAVRGALAKVSPETSPDSVEKIVGDVNQLLVENTAGLHTVAKDVSITKVKRASAQPGQPSGVSTGVEATPGAAPAPVLAAPPAATPAPTTPPVEEQPAPVGEQGEEIQGAVDESQRPAPIPRRKVSGISGVSSDDSLSNWVGSVITRTDVGDEEIQIGDPENVKTRQGIMAQKTAIYRDALGRAQVIYDNMQKTDFMTRVERRGLVKIMSELQKYPEGADAIKTAQQAITQKNTTVDEKKEAVKSLIDLYKGELAKADSEQASNAKFLDEWGMEKAKFMGTQENREWRREYMLNASRLRERAMNLSHGDKVDRVLFDAWRQLRTDINALRGNEVRLATSWFTSKNVIASGPDEATVRAQIERSPMYNKFKNKIRFARNDQDGQWYAYGDAPKIRVERDLSAAEKQADAIEAKIKKEHPGWIVTKEDALGMENIFAPAEEGGQGEKPSWEQ